MRVSFPPETESAPPGPESAAQAPGASRTLTGPGDRSWRAPWTLSRIDSVTITGAPFRETITAIAGMSYARAE